MTGPQSGSGRPRGLDAPKDGSRGKAGASGGDIFEQKKGLALVFEDLLRALPTHQDRGGIGISRDQIGKA